ncbi:MAG: RNA methyltransferase [Candidatus Cryptobacteroides sp.]|nr:RNA methyltransferase [Bacteroidales bacterium]MDY6157537.1 RNA methyltransferase [Candidatus Cryptobacteroides sp.]
MEKRRLTQEPLNSSRIKLIRSLRDKKFRDEYGLFVVEGEKMVRELCDSGYELEAIYREEEIGSAMMERISLCSSASPVLALARIPKRDSRDSQPAPGLCLALDSVRDPGNVGTILRSADWFGVSRVYLSEDCADIYNPKVVQASMGSLFRVKISVCDVAELCRNFRSVGKDVFGTVLDGEDIYRCELPDEGLIVMGNESRGISEAVRRELSRRLRIPSFGGSRAESLNVAVATAVTLSIFRGK